MRKYRAVQSKNIFWVLLEVIRRRRLPLKFKLVGLNLFLVGTALIGAAWIMNMQLKSVMHQYSQAIGQSLVAQTAASAAEILMTHDMLSLNVMLKNIDTNPLVERVAIYSLDNRLLAESGPKLFFEEKNQSDSVFSAPINFQEVVVGRLRITLDMQHFNKPLDLGLWSITFLGILLILFSLYTSLKLSEHITGSLVRLCTWLRLDQGPIPDIHRLDELGDLARQLQVFSVTTSGMAEKNKTQTNQSAARESLDDLHLESMHMASEDAARYRDPNSAPSLLVIPEPTVVVLVVRIVIEGQLHAPTMHHLDVFLERYRSVLVQSSALYNGIEHSLKDGVSLLVFEQAKIGADCLVHALCCGELIRACGYLLQTQLMERGMSMHLELALAEIGTVDVLGIQEHRLSVGVQNVVDLSQHSRNLLLLDTVFHQDNRLTKKVCLRRLTNNQSISYVERILEPYASLVDSQLSRVPID